MKSRWWAWALIVGLCVGVEAKQTTSIDERVAIKTVVKHWEEQEYLEAQKGIEEFLIHHPQSVYVDELSALLGDLYFSQKNYEKAVQCYAPVQNKGRSEFHYLHSLYELQRYEPFIALAKVFVEDPRVPLEELHTITFEMAEVYFCQAHHSDEKRPLYKQAKTYYERLRGTPLEEGMLLELAQTYEALGEFNLAAKAYFSLASRHPHKTEELLFQAACAQIHFDREAATSTFDQILHLQGDLFEKAAYNKLALYFQMQKYQDFILDATLLSARIPESKKALIQYYFAQALCHEHEWMSAKEVLLGLLEGEFKRPALLTLVACAKHLHSVEVSRTILSQAPSFSPAELSAITTLHIHLCKEAHLWKEAREHIDQLLAATPGQESLLYDRAILLMQEGLASEGVEAFEVFVEACPHSPHVKKALHNALYLCTEVLQEKGKEPLVDVLSFALDRHELFSHKENKEMRLLLARTLLDLNHGEEAAGFLSEYVRDFSGDPSLSDAYMLWGACYKGIQDKHFIDYSEKALHLNAQLQGDSTLHRSLFNAYLRYIGTRPEEEKATLLSKAAEHLFLVTDGSVTEENQRWLAGYYLEHDTTKARTLLEALLGGGQFTLAQEAEVMQLAALYQQEEAYDKLTSLLEKLVNTQREASGGAWKYHRRALFELGNAQCLLGNEKRATELYQELIASASHVSSYFALAAQLELAKLQLSNIQKQGMEDGEQIRGILNTLRDVEIKQQLSSEPLHLEASLYYAAIKVELTPPEERIERQQLLLENMKKNISDQLSRSPTENKELLEDYLAYVTIKLAHQNTEVELKRLLERNIHATLKKRIIQELEHSL